MPIPRIKVIDRTYAAILAAKSPMERIAMIGEMNRTARVIVEAGARYRHPDWTDAQIAAEVAFRMLKPDDSYDRHLRSQCRAHLR